MRNSTASMFASDAADVFSKQNGQIGIASLSAALRGPSHIAIPHLKQPVLIEPFNMAGSGFFSLSSIRFLISSSAGQPSTNVGSCSVESTISSKIQFYLLFKPTNCTASSLVAARRLYCFLRNPNVVIGCCRSAVMSDLCLPLRKFATNVLTKFFSNPVTKGFEHLILSICRCWWSEAEQKRAAD